MPIATPTKPRRLLGSSPNSLLGSRAEDPASFSFRDQPAVRRLLLIAYHFPPHGGSGVQRPLKLAKYLPDHGWSVNVLTTGHNRYPLLDPSLLNEIPRSVAVHRQGGWEPADVVRSRFVPGAFRDRIYWRLNSLVERLPLPEPQLLWLPRAARTAERIVRENAIDAVLTTSPPHCGHLIGRRLQRRLGIPWIADLRDPIVGNFAYAARSRIGDAFLRRLDSMAIHCADAIVTTCEDLTADLRARHGALPESRLHTITNGFDSDDVADNPIEPRRDRFVIAHVGAFYAGQRIEPILAALRRLRADCPDFAARSEFRVIGSISAAQRRTLDPADLSMIVETGYQPHRAAVAEMADADLLILMTPDSPGGRLCIPAKTFEYLAFGKRILAVAHLETHLDRLLSLMTNCRTITHDNASDLAREIKCAFDDWNHGIIFPLRDSALLRPFDRRAIAGQFAQIADELTQASTARVRDPAFVRIAR